MKWHTFAIVLLLVLLVWFISSSQCQSDPYRPPVISSGAEYQVKVKEAEELSLAVLEKYEAGETLTDGDKDRLRRGAAITKGLIGFRPEASSLYVGLTKSYLALGQNGDAHEWAQNGIGTIPLNPDDLRLKVIEAELHFVSSRALEREREYDRAEIEAENAVRLLQGDTKIAKTFSEMYRSEEPYKLALANYLAQLASVKVQISQLSFEGSGFDEEQAAKIKEQRLSEARSLVRSALILVPEHKHARQLNLLLQSALQPAS